MLISTQNHPFSKISIIGLGYIGLPTAALLASKNIPVHGVDINQNTVDIINQGAIHIMEPGLDSLVHSVVSAGYLKASTQVQSADVFLIAVPTPIKADNQPDLSYIEAATRSIAPVLKKGNLVILESTSPVGTTEQIANWFSDERPDLSFPKSDDCRPDVNVVYCPERILPGRMLHELVNNDRVIGGISAQCSARALQLYNLFVEGTRLITNSRTAEMCKLAENSFRDVNIAFANELSLICDKLDINVWDLIKLANYHPRVHILQPGPGVGGHCIAVDPWFIVNSAPDLAHLIKTAREVNNSKPQWVLNKLKTAILEYLTDNASKQIKDITIACFGLAFKADIDDLRESPALEIVKSIADMHPGPLLVIEPNISELPRELQGNIRLETSEAALRQADIVLLLVAHHQFKENRSAFSGNFILIDTLGLYTTTRVIVPDVCAV